MFNNDPNAFREVIYMAWDKHRGQQPLSPLEKQIVGVIEMHPEYHAFFDARQAPSEHNNPFYHLGLHLAIIDQISTNRPEGIRPIYVQLHKRLGDDHAVDHAIMQCLESYMQHLHAHASPPDDATYLTRLQKLIED